MCWGSHRAASPPRTHFFVPAAYMAQHSLDTCQVCGLLVARRFNGAHPRCRPQVQAAASQAPQAPNPAPATGPDLAEVFQARIPIQRHVPKAARSVWAQCLARALAAVACHNSLPAWRDFLMLPKAVLRPPRRGGAKRRDAAAQHTLRRCRRWLEGEREELWEPCPAAARRQPSGSEAAVAAKHARCKSLAAEGEMSRACAALLNPPPLAAEDSVLAKLHAKHLQSQPARPGLVQLGPPPGDQAPDLSVDLVLSVACSFRRGTAAGPTGLRGDHLREALSSPHWDEVAAHLADVVRLLAWGRRRLSSPRTSLGLPFMFFPRVRTMSAPLQLVKL